MPEMGNNRAKLVAGGLIKEFPTLRFGLLVGIAGGIPDGDTNDIRLGDVVVSRPKATHGGVINFDVDGSTAESWAWKGMLKRPPDIVLQNVERLRSLHILGRGNSANHLTEMIGKYPNMGREGYSSPGPSQDMLFISNYVHQGGSTCQRCDKNYATPRKTRESTMPRIHYGTIRSVPEVVRNSRLRDALRDRYQILCVEMEAAGLYEEFPCVVIRGICDYADSHKNKKWQTLAAATAAAYAKELLCAIPASEMTQADPIPINNAEGFLRMLDQYNELQQQSIEESMEMQRAQAFWNPLESMSK